jgi:AraC-like DNA-binding protein
MQLLFSTDNVHPRDRLAYWREEATKAFVAHEFTSHTGRDFNGKISAGMLGQIPIALFEGDPCLVARTRACLKSAADDDLLLCHQMGGTSIHQDGRDGIPEPPDIGLLDPRREFELRARNSAKGLIFKIPRLELERRLGDVTKYTALPLSGREPIATIASQFLRMTTKRAPMIDAQSSIALAQHALDLVALAFAASSGCVPRLSSPRTATLIRLKSTIERRLHEVGLKPADVAEAAGISVRYANALLSQEDSSLERYIMLRRLQHCRRALESSAHASRSVADIAYSYGFADLSHFTRRFKAEFGCSPGEFRRSNRDGAKAHARRFRK